MVSRYYWRYDPVKGHIYSALGVRLRDLVVNAPADSLVTVQYEPARRDHLGAWDWRTVQLVKRSGPGFCLSRYRYVYQDPSGAWGLWLPVGGALRYFGAFPDEDEAAIAANYLGPRWCREVFRVERVERRGPIPVRPAPVPAPTSDGVPGTRRLVRFDYADGRVEFVEP